MAEVEIIKASVSTNHIENYAKKKKKKRVCAYCRVSTDLEDQKTSYYSQIEHYTNYIKSNKDWEFAGIYADEGITGTQIKKRDDFIRMLDDCKAGKIDMIIAKSISRFARNTVDTLNTVRQLRELDIDVYFEKENIHTLNLDSEMFLTLYSAFAQAESESTSMNVKLGYRAKMKRGEPCGSIQCYGYIWDKNKKELIINEEEAKIVRRVFKEYLNGSGSSVIAKMLTNEGIPSPSGGKKWHPSPIKDMIRNVKYIGDLCGQKFYVENPISHRLVRNRGQQPMYYAKNHHKPIIDRKTWDKAQEIYNQRSVKIKEGKEYCEKFSMRYTFSSMIYCEHCGQSYVRRYTKYRNKDGVVHDNIYWTCSSTVSHTSKECGKAVTIRDEEIKSLYVALFNKFLTSSKNADFIKMLKNTISKDNSEEKLNKINKRIEQIKDKMSKLIDLSLHSNIETDVFNNKNYELNKELIELYKQKDEVTNSKMYIEKEQKKFKMIEKELNKSSTIHRFDDEGFKKLVNKVIIGDYDENNNYDPNVIKFILTIRSVASNEPIKFLSYELDEGLYKTISVSLGGNYVRKRRIIKYCWRYKYNSFINKFLI